MISLYVYKIIYSKVLSICKHKLIDTTFEICVYILHTTNLIKFKLSSKFSYQSHQITRKGKIHHEGSYFKVNTFSYNN